MKKRTVSKIKKYNNAPIMMAFGSNEIFVTYYSAEYEEILDDAGVVIESLPVSFSPIPYTKEDIINKLQNSIKSINDKAEFDKIKVQTQINEILALG